MNALLAGARADLLRFRRWPALWVMAGGWLLLNIIFAYVFPYLSYRSEGGGGFSTEGVPREQLLAEVLPGAVPVAVVQGMPMFGGAIMLTIGALVAGSGYGWGTWKSTFTQGHGRLTVIGGMLVALAAVIVAVIVVTLVVDLGIATALAAAEGKSLAPPAAGDLIGGFGSGFLIFGMWALAGVAVATIARSPALAIGLGVVWVLAVENLLRGVSTLLEAIRPVVDVLPGTAAGSVAAAFGAAPVSEGGTPGVVTNLTGFPAVAVSVGYIAAFAVGTALLVRRRDIV